VSEFPWSHMLSGAIGAAIATIWEHYKTKKIVAKINSHPDIINVRKQIAEIMEDQARGVNER